MKPESDPRPSASSHLDSQLQAAKSERSPASANRVHQQVMQELSADAAASAFSGWGWKAGIAAAAVIVLVVSSAFFPSAVPPKTENTASLPLEWIQGSSQEHVTPAVRIAMTDPYRLQQETLTQDVQATLAFLDRAVPRIP